MNRQQRRAAEKVNKKRQQQGLSYAQGVAIASEAYKKGQDVADTTQAQIFMYTFALVIKVLREQWGWGYKRLSRLAEQLLQEYNENDMSLEELEKWCWEYGGFKLQISDQSK